jgi:hypothetical protein
MSFYTFRWYEGKPEEFHTIFTEDAVFETCLPGKKEILYGKQFLN